ncbi:MAG TPA: MFS transporter [Galbitalea sp.]|jgi:UMF1 family MFS transporter|nr:MFS transporter [Galbitalea sp.]
MTDALPDDGLATSAAATKLIAAGLSLPEDAVIPRRRIAAWAFWDWGGSAFNAIMTTFVFSVYLTSTGFGNPDKTTAALGVTGIIGGVLVAAIAPITGQRSDGTGRRKLLLGIDTAIVVLCIGGTFFVKPDHAYLLLGLVLLAVGTLFFELATVNYNAMLAQVSSARTVGRVSGFGWSMGYFGGIVLLLILYFGFIHPDVGLLGVTSKDGLSVRVSMVLAAIWMLGFSIPIFAAVPEPPVTVPRAARRTPAQFAVGIARSYRELFRTIGGLWTVSRATVGFLIASAIFRDGLTGVFTYGGVLARVSFGFSAGDVIVFAIAANVVAGVSTVLIGRLDDVIGPKRVMVGAIAGTIVAGLAVFVFHTGGTLVFWVFGLLMCVFVGPAQSASRSFLARVIPAGHEGEVFGLYQTTGRAATVFAPLLFTLFVTVFGKSIYGIIGIVIVLAVGLAVLIPIKENATALK